MTRPFLDKLTQKISSKYTLTVLAAKRAHQLKERTQDKPKPFSDLITQALEEIAEGKISYKPAEEEKEEPQPEEK